MITNEEKSAWASEFILEEKLRLERSSAPTVRDLRAAADGLLPTIAAEPDSTSLPAPGLRQDSALSKSSST